MIPPLPQGFSLTLDVDTVRLNEGAWFRASSGLALRLTTPGVLAWEELSAGTVNSRRAGRLARRLTDDGFAHPVPPSLREKPDLSVVIPVRDRIPDLERCLTSLGTTYPVVVVDDGSLDAAAVAQVAAAHGARLIRLATNRGPAAARNVGFAALDTDLVAFVDSDTVPGRHWIARLAAHFADPAVGAVAPRVVPLVQASTVGKYAAARCSLDLGQLPARVVPYGRVSYVPAAALLVRRRAVLDVALGHDVFDAQLRTGEDVDLVWRLHEAGWRVRYDPGEEVGHREPSTWRGLLRRRHSYGLSASVLARRHPSAMAPLFLVPGLARQLIAGVIRRRRTGSDELARLSTSAGVRGTLQTWRGTGRYLVQFAPWLLAVGMLNRRTRLATAALALAPVLGEWRGRRSPIDPLSFSIGYLADEISYGSGVIAGCIRNRTLVPLRPVVVRRSS